MTLFHNDGHLTDQGLQALVDGLLNDTEGLEAAEHLSFCDDCLLRYTNLLEGAPLLKPETPLKEGVHRRIRMRGLRVAAGRTAKVAAAACLAVGLWGGVTAGATGGRQQDAATEGTSISYQVNNAVNNFTGSLDQFFRQFTGPARSTESKREERYRKQKEDVFTNTPTDSGGKPAG